MTSLSSDKERKKDKKPDYSPKNSQEYKIYTNNEDIADQFNMAQTWPVQLTKAMKILHNISRHLQLIVLLWKMSQKLTGF